MVEFAIGSRGVLRHLPGLLLASVAAAQSHWNWGLTQASGALPGQRYGHALAYDHGRQRLCLFGGIDDWGLPTNSIQEFDGTTWQLRAATTSPPPRGGHAMAYDPLRGRVVLFGGFWDPQSPYGLDDTWEWDGTTWRQLQPTTRPSRRYEHTLAFDVGLGRVVLFAGRTNAIAILGDTWQWDGQAWQPFPFGNPPVRCRHALAYDHGRGRLVLFGGRSNLFDLGDTWERLGTQWQQVQTSGPSARHGHAMAYDPQRGISVLQGGSRDGHETWEWDGATWTLAAARTAARSDHAMAFDPGLGRTVLYGGLAPAAAVLAPLLFGDLRDLGPNLPGAFAMHGQGCGTLQPLQLQPAPGAALPQPGLTTELSAGPAAQRVFFVFGWSATQDGSTPLPFDLAGYGLPGCTLQTSRDATTSVLAAAPEARLPLWLPPLPALRGLTVQVQAFAVAPGANAVGMVASNRLEIAIGG